MVSAEPLTLTSMAAKSSRASLTAAGRNAVNKLVERIADATAHRVLKAGPGPGAGVGAGSVEPTIQRLLARQISAQSQDTWQRFKLYRADGNLIPVLSALNEIYLRQQRIEAKLDRLLGHDHGVSDRSTAPRLRHVVLPLPQPPSAAAAPESLLMTAPWSMFIPRLLGERGLGGYERACLPVFLAALDHAGPGDVLDIGANVGPYALLAGALSQRRVRAFEPVPDLAGVARATAATAGFDVEVAEVALGASDGIARLYLSDSSDTSNSLDPSFRTSTSSIEVPVRTLDSWAAEHGLEPAVLKIDTETTEPAVLAGAGGTVAARRPWIFCEVLAGKVEAELTEVMRDWGYTWYHLDGAYPALPQSRIVGDKTMNSLMWLFTPEPIGDDFWDTVAAWTKALDNTAPPSSTLADAVVTQ